MYYIYFRRMCYISLSHTRVWYSRMRYIYKAPRVLLFSAFRLYINCLRLFVVVYIYGVLVTLSCTYIPTFMATTANIR